MFLKFSRGHARLTFLLAMATEPVLDESVSATVLVEEKEPAAGESEVVQSGEDATNDSVEDSGEAVEVLESGAVESGEATTKDSAAGEDATKDSVGESGAGEAASNDSGEDSGSESEGDTSNAEAAGAPARPRPPRACVVSVCMRLVSILTLICMRAGKPKVRLLSSPKCSFLLVTCCWSFLGNAVLEILYPQMSGTRLPTRMRRDLLVA